VAHCLPAGINFIGRPRLACGTSIHARLLISALQRGGIDVAVYDVEGELADRQHDTVEYYRTIPNISELPYKTTFLFDIPVALIKFIDMLRTILPDHHFISNLSWEFETIPPPWIPSFQDIDTWCAPSDFLVQTLKRSLGIQPVHIPVTPMSRELVVGVKAPLGFGMADSPFTFYLNFDLLSGIQRKNPQIAIDAFLAAFGDRSDVRLLIKAWGSGSSKLTPESIAGLTGAHKNISVITESFDYTQNLALMKTCQAYVSPHHAEGLGLGLLEAMSFGMPVIATNYSACTDYLDENSGIPLPFTRVAWSAADGHVGENTWAQPDINAMVLAMQRVVADQEYYHRISRGALARYEQRLESFLTLDWAQHMMIPNRLPQMVH
jgi:glycosyltransferase involved in cell wall biosynthesis